MEHNEGREPTDAAAEAIEALRQRFDRWWHEVGSGIAPGVLEEWSEHAERVARAAWVDGAFLSGTRPLPDTAGEVAQPAEFPVGWNEMPPEDVLRAEAKVSGWMREHRIKEWALGHSASRDMVAALRAEVARLKDALIDREIERNQLLAGMQEELTAQRLLERCGCLYLGNGVEVAISGTTARVAELEALCRVTLGQGKTIVSDASINGIMGGAPTTLLIQVLDESHTIGDDATGFGRDNLEPGDGNVQIVFTKAESVDVVIDTLFKIKGEIESTPAAPEGEGGGK